MFVTPEILGSNIMGVSSSLPITSGVRTEDVVVQIVKPTKGKLEYKIKFDLK